MSFLQTWKDHTQSSWPLRYGSEAFDAPSDLVYVDLTKWPPRLQGALGPQSTLHHPLNHNRRVSTSVVDLTFRALLYGIPLSTHTTHRARAKSKNNVIQAVFGDKYNPIQSNDDIAHSPCRPVLLNSPNSRLLLRFPVIQTRYPYAISQPACRVCHLVAPGEPGERPPERAHRRAFRWPNKLNPSWRVHHTSKYRPGST